MISRIPTDYVSRRAFASILLAVVFACSSNDSKREEPESRAPLAATPSAFRALRAHDNATREARLREQLQPLLEHHGGDLPRNPVRPNVTRVPLQSRFGHAVAVHRRQDGRLEFGCFDDASRLSRFVTGHAGEAVP